MSPGHAELTHEGVLVVSIDHAPVNAIAGPVRRLLFDALRRADGDPAVRAVVVTGNARLFSAGADLGEFAAGSAMLPPSLHGDIVPLMAAMTKPVVAAVRGAALGGGLELALGCHDRIFATGTRVGLPETTLGLMPGAGGTQLLPRAVGLSSAADLIAAGHVVPIERIATTALAHAVVDDARLVDDAIRRALQLCDAPSPFRAIADVPVADEAARAQLHALIADVRQRRDALPGVVHALEAISWTTSTSIADGMRAEFARFEPLLASIESRALRHVFAAERRRKRDADVDAFEVAFVARVEERLAAECAAMRADGVDAHDVARAMTRWGWPHRLWFADGATADDRGAHDAAIVARLLRAATDEGRRTLERRDGASANDPVESDLDLALVRRAGFPRVRGGPFFQAAEGSAGRDVSPERSATLQAIDRPAPATRSLQQPP